MPEFELPEHSALSRDALDFLDATVAGADDIADAISLRHGANLAHHLATLISVILRGIDREAESEIEAVRRFTKAMRGSIGGVADV